jgi:uncharacterized DUF497 family protein
MRKDLRIDELVIEKDRPGHILKHEVTIEEVLQVVNGSYIFIEAKFGRWKLIGITSADRFLVIIIGERVKENTFGLITARPAHKKERSLYQEILNKKKE